MSKPLPKIKTLEYSAILPLSKIEVKFRPYTVADEKMLAAISTSKNTDPKFFIDNTIKVAQNNITNDVDVRYLTSLDVRYLMLKLRSKSVGESIDLEKDGKPFKLDIDQIYLKDERGPEDYKIILSDGETGLELRDLTFEEETIIAAKYKDKESQVEMVFDMLNSSVKTIFNNEEVWIVGTDVNAKDVEEFLGSINSTDSRKLYDFIQSSPQLAIDVEIDGTLTTITNREVDFLS